MNKTNICFYSVNCLFNTPRNTFVYFEVENLEMLEFLRLIYE